MGHEMLAESESVLICIAVYGGNHFTGVTPNGVVRITAMEAKTKASAHPPYLFHGI